MRFLSAPRAALRFATGLALVATALGGSPAGAETADVPAGIDGPAIVKQVVTQMSAFEAAYPIQESRRKVRIREMDPDDGTLLGHRLIDQRAWGRVGENPRREILRCEIDGEVVEPSDCADKDRLAPPLRIFGPDGPHNYEFELAGKVRFEGVESWRIRVTPRDRTVRHFDGNLFVAVDDLRLLGTEGTLADHPFGLEALAVHLCFTQTPDGPVVRHGKIDFTLHIPLIVHRRIVSEFDASEQKLLAAGS